MWKPEHRIAAVRSGLRYPSDLTGAEWAVVEPMVPPAKHGGRKRTAQGRGIVMSPFALQQSQAICGRRCYRLGHLWLRALTFSPASKRACAIRL